MATDTLIAGLPPNTPLGNGCTIVLEAIDPATGLAVTGVEVSEWAIYLESDSAANELASGPFMPVLIPTRQT